MTMHDDETELPVEVIEMLRQPALIDPVRMEATIAMAHAQRLLQSKRTVFRRQWLVTAAAASIAFVLGWGGHAASSRAAAPARVEPATSEVITDAGAGYARALAAIPTNDAQAKAAAAATFRSVAAQVVRLGIDDMEMKVALRYALRASSTRPLSNAAPTAVWF